MKKKKWIDWKNEECPYCGDGVGVCTDADQDNIFPEAYDGDAAKCTSCKWEGNIIVDSDSEGIGWARLSEGNLEELEKVNPFGPDPL